MNLEVVDDAAAVAARVAERIVEAQPRSLVLTGGSTVGATYRLLASGELGPLPWGELTVLFGDERCVPPESDESNYRLAERTLLSYVGAGRVERMRGEELDRDAEAARYADLVPDVLDVTLLGMGADGHCASLFPGEPSTDERERLCVASLGHYDPRERLTLTFPALNRSRLVLFLAAGEAKADALARIAAGEDLPSARVRPTDGEVVWVVDRAAAGGVGSSHPG